MNAGVIQLDDPVFWSQTKIDIRPSAREETECEGMLNILRNTKRATLLLTRFAMGA